MQFGFGFLRAHSSSVKGSQLDPDRGPDRISTICSSINGTQQFSDQLGTVGCPDLGTEQLDLDRGHHYSM